MPTFLHYLSSGLQFLTICRQNVHFFAPSSRRLKVNLLSPDGLQTKDTRSAAQTESTAPRAAPVWLWPSPRASCKSTAARFSSARTRAKRRGGPHLRAGDRRSGARTFWARHQTCPGQSGQSRPLAGCFASNHARKTQPLRPPSRAGQNRLRISGIVAFHQPGVGRDSIEP